MPHKNAEGSYMKNYKTILLILLGLLVSAQAWCGGSSDKKKSRAPAPTAYYVRADGNSRNPGTSETAAFPDLYYALNKAKENPAITKIVVIGALEVENEIVTFNNNMRRGLSLTITGKPDATEQERAVLRGHGSARVLNIASVGYLWEGKMTYYDTRYRLEHITVTGGIAAGADEAGTGGGILVNHEATLTLGPGVLITGNHAVNGGGIAVAKNSSLIIEGGEISDNIAENTGGGLYAENKVITMKSGKISGNQAVNGGGVYTSEATEFVLEDGEISDNIASTAEYWDLRQYPDRTWYSYPRNGFGGGVAAFKLTMKGGKISGNIVNGGLAQGGGVCIRNANKDKFGTFIMEGGEISGNTAKTVSTDINDGSRREGWGNAVYIIGNFTMRSGIISGNSGDGIWVEGEYNGLGKAAFIMEGGEITNHEFTGVLTQGVNFTMRGGKISGNQNSGVTISNTSFVMRGGEIVNNKGSYGGGIQSGGAGSTILIQGGRVEGNTATKEGNDIYDPK
jgi:hypothetical protein